MDDMSLVGKCGIYCGACCIYRAERDGGVLVERLAAAFECPPDKIRCNGCGDLKPDSWSNDCDIVACLKDKGFGFCYECHEFENRSCEKYEDVAQRHLESGEDMRGALDMIRDGGPEEWLRESKARWTCGHCGNPLIGGRKECHHCHGQVA
jgi:hypothetical protein